MESRIGILLKILAKSYLLRRRSCITILLFLTNFCFAQFIDSIKVHNCCPISSNDTVYIKTYGHFGNGSMYFTGQSHSVVSNTVYVQINICSSWGPDVIIDFTNVEKVNPLFAGNYVLKVNLLEYSLAYNVPCSNYAGTDTMSTSFIVVDPDFLKEYNFNEEIRLYPQPAKDELNLNFAIAQANDFKTISIYNSLGQLVKEEEITFNNIKASLSTTNLPAGIYLLKLSSGNGHFGLPSGKAGGLNVQISKRFVIEK